MTKALVTGAAGFIGNALCKELLRNGYQVVGVDNLFRGKKEALPQTNEFKFYEADILQANTIAKIVDQEMPEIVFHYAAINGTKYLYDRPWFVLDSNIQLARNVVNACRNSAVKKIVYSSSSEIYGENPVIPTREDRPIELISQTDRNSYSISKAVDEFYVRLFCQLESKDYLIVRIFNVYGPFMDSSSYGQVIPEFIRKILHDKEFTIIGDGTQTRSFCYVEDNVRLTVKLASIARNDIVNVGTDEEISMLELARKLHEIMGRKFEPVFLPGREHDPVRRCPDISKMYKLISSKANVPLEEGLKRTIEWYKASQGSP